jgi:hypothetical protein
MKDQLIIPGHLTHETKEFSICKNGDMIFKEENLNVNKDSCDQGRCIEMHTVS